MKKFYILFFFYSFFAHLALAQPSSPTNPSQIAEWEVQVSEGGFQLNKSEKNFMHLVSSLERLISFQCFPNYKKENAYNPQNTSESCRSTIDRLLHLDLENPVGICARDGIETKSCQVAFEQQELAKYVPGQSMWLDKNAREYSVDVETKLAESSALAKSEPIWKEIGALNSQLTLHPDEKKDIQPRLDNAYDRLFNVVCNVVRYRIIDQHYLAKVLQLENLPSPQATTTTSLGGLLVFPTPTATPARPIEQIFKSMAEKGMMSGEEQTKVKLPPKRMRYVSPTCKFTIERVLVTDAKEVAAICAMHGLYSPNCLRARLERESSRQAQSPGQVSKPTAPKGNDFSTF